MGYLCDSSPPVPEKFGLPDICQRFIVPVQLKVKAHCKLVEQCFKPGVIMVINRLCGAFVVQGKLQE